MASGLPQRDVSVLPEYTDDALEVLEREHGNERVTVTDLIERNRDPELIRRLAIRDFIDELKRRRKPK